MQLRVLNDHSLVPFQPVRSSLSQDQGAQPSGSCHPGTSRSVQLCICV